MKTPRELLLERHREAQPLLDAIRNEICAGLKDHRPSPAGNTTFALEGFLTMAWQELFVSCRRYWVGLGAAWCVIVLSIVVGQSGGGRVQVVAAQRPEPVLQAMREQEQLRAELLGSSSTPRSVPARHEEKVDQRSHVFNDQAVV